ncbi:MAG: hypothetical protein M3Q74_02035, partial [Pseudomonadota bacterium]|nr:hypothetical protein [Pseudomonadota bacterium]
GRTGFAHLFEHLFFLDSENLGPGGLDAMSARIGARAFETAVAKLDVLEAIGDYGLPADYLTREAQVVEGLTVRQVQALAAEHLRTDGMIYVVVGDAATQAARLEGLGYGPVVIVNDRLAEANQ